MMRGLRTLIVASLLLSACHSMGQQGSPYHPPSTPIPSGSATAPTAVTQGLQPTSEPTDVTLTADGYFTDQGIKISFLRECAETTLKDGYDSFKLLDYSVAEPRHRHKVANGSIIEIRGNNEDRQKQIYDARKALTDQYF
jgi:hypothetical protein